MVTAVAPRAGAWIETGDILTYKLIDRSHPARARGLKLKILFSLLVTIVAPRAGAWIETISERRSHEQNSRTPRGRVD